MAAFPPPPNPADARSRRRVAREQDQLRHLAPQPSSILGPAILLGIGVLFLLVELGHLSFGRLLSLSFRWSPILLVGLGVVRLVEWFIDRRRLERATAEGLPFQPTRVGPGYGLLFVLFFAFSIIGSVVSRHHHDRFADGLLFNQDQNWSQFFGERHESRDTLAYACPPGSSVSISVEHGDITVAGTSPDNQIHVATHTTVFSSSDADAAQRSRSVQPHFSTEGGHITLTAPASQNAELDLDVTLPPATTLTLNADHGDLSLSDLNAPATVTANHGDVTLSNIQGAVVARLNNSGSSISAHRITGTTSISGRLEDITLSDATGAVTLEGDIFGDLHLERLGGPLHLRTSRIDLEAASLAGTLEAESGGDLSADQITGPVMINTRNRNITLDAVEGPLTINNQNGTVSATLVHSLAPVDINNRHGEVTLELPSTAAFTLDAATTDADLTNAFGLTSNASDDKPELQGTVGSGGPAIHVRTTQGDIAINKSANVAITPTPRRQHPPSAPASHGANPSAPGETTF